MTLHPVQRVLVAVVLLGLGFFVAPLLRGFFASDAEWDEQIRADAETALQVMRPDSRLPADLSGETGFWQAWDARLDLYDAEQRADLRERLLLYVAFLDAEWSEVAEIYTSGVDPRELSTEIRDVRGRLDEAFGPFAEKLRSDADRVREEAYGASPVHSGLDPDLPDFREEAAILREWLPRARERAIRLTTPRADRE